MLNNQLNEVLLKKEFYPKDVIIVLKNYDISNLAIKKVDYKKLYETKVRHYTLEQHTLIVMNEFEKYFSIDLPIDRNLLRIMLALHDIGKPQAFLKGNRNNQYEYTVEIINDLRAYLPFNNSEIDLCIALVSTDTLGMYMLDKISIETAKSKIISLANKTSLGINSFFKLMTIYYQCDVASYTKDAGGFAYLEHLFIYQNNNKFFDRVNNRLKFSDNFEMKFIKLENYLLL